MAIRKARGITGSETANRSNNIVNVTRAKTVSYFCNKTNLRARIQRKTVV